MDRFFTDQTLSMGGPARLEDPEDLRHLCKVLRLQEGNSIELVDSRGTQYIVRLEEVSAQKVLGRVVGIDDTPRELPLSVHLFQGLPKADKMDLVIQKATELGVASVTPVLFERCVSRPPNDHKKSQRWQKIALQAAKQSKRARIPAVWPIRSFEELLKELGLIERSLLLYEKERGQHLANALRTALPQSIALVIGPEGGVSEEEAMRLEQIHTLQTVSLGPRILRTETAALSALAMIGAQAEGISWRGLKERTKD